MTDRRFDAVVVGAGPAGLAAAIVLGRNGLRTLVCERAALPRDKACGEGVMPTGVEYLAELGGRAYLEEQHLRRLEGIRFRSAAGHVATARFAKGYGLGIRRTNLSAALLEAARSWPSVEVRQAATVRPAKATAKGVCVQLGGETVTARLLVAADGIYSSVRRWAGLDRRAPWPRRLGARQHFAIELPEPFVDVLQGQGIEAYLTPCGEREAGLAFLWDPAVYRHAQKGPRLLASLLAAFPELERRLVGARAISEPLACGPLRRLARRRATDGIVLIGDAGGYIDACTGEGISIALAQALALEPTVVPLLKRRQSLMTSSALTPFVSECQRITRPYQIATRFQLYLCRHPRVANRLVRALEKDEQIPAHFVSASMGRTTFWPGWRASSRLAKSILAPGRR